MMTLYIVPRTLKLPLDFILLFRLAKSFDI